MGIARGLSTDLGRAVRGARPSHRVMVGIALGVVTAASTVRAESGDRCQRNVSCRVHADKGVSYSERKNYAEALVEFEAAYAAEPAPRLLLNIGRSLYRLERPQEALDYYSRYRREVTSLDSEAEKVVRRYELDALMAVAVTERAGGGPEPPPQPLRPQPPDGWPPRASLGLLGAGVGLFVLGIGLGAGAINAANDISQSGNNFMPFGAVAQATQSRGMALQTAGITFDVLALLSLTAGAASLGTWLYLKKTGQMVSSTSLGSRYAAAAGVAPRALISSGGL